jgi:hypothetical protein
VISIENEECYQRNAKYAIKYADYEKYVILKKICRICTPHFADDDHRHFETNDIKGNFIVT